MNREIKFNIEALLQPIAGSNAAGEELENEMIYERIRQARISDPDFLPQDEWSSAPRKADWGLVARLSEEVLINQSKDLQIACWLAEAWVHLHQSEGLRAGLELINGFLRQCWPQSWPALTEDGATFRHGMLIRLDRDLSQILKLKPWLHAMQSSLLWWQQVLSFEHQGHQSVEDEQQEDYSMAAFIQWASKQDACEVARVMADVEASQQLIVQVEHSYTALQPESEGALFAQSHEIIGDVYDFLMRLHSHTSSQQDEVMTLNVLSDPASTEPQSFRQPQVMSRDLAITQMLTIAHFFRQTEPSSPVPMLMERAARWANMPLSEWLVEMVGDERSLQEINFVLHGPSR